MNFMKWLDKHIIVESPIPPEEGVYIDEIGDEWLRVFQDENLIRLGYAPKPRNRLEQFIHDVAHGILMRYPLWKVILWSVRFNGMRNSILEVDFTGEWFEVMNEILASDPPHGFIVIIDENPTFTQEEYHNFLKRVSGNDE